MAAKEVRVEIDVLADFQGWRTVRFSYKVSDATQPMTDELLAEFHRQLDIAVRQSTEGHEAGVTGGGIL